MGELEDRINGILGDPSQMEQITRLAQSLMGGGDGDSTDSSPLPGIDSAMLRKISRMMSSSAGSKNEALLAAMKPYLSEKRRGKMDKAMKLARLARIAQLAMNETEDGNDA